MAHECEPLPVASICVLTIGRWGLTLVRVVSELITGGISISAGPAGAPRRKLYGYLFSHSVPSLFKARARQHRAWQRDGLFRLGRSERDILVSRSGWVVPSVDVGRSRQFLWWTLQAIRVDDECLTLMARRSTAASWLGA